MDCDTSEKINLMNFRGVSLNAVQVTNNKFYTDGFLVCLIVTWWVRILSSRIQLVKSQLEPSG